MSWAYGFNSYSLANIQKKNVTSKNGRDIFRENEIRTNSVIDISEMKVELYKNALRKFV